MEVMHGAAERKTMTVGSYFYDFKNRAAGKGPSLGGKKKSAFRHVNVWTYTRGSGISEQASWVPVRLLRRKVSNLSKIRPIMITKSRWCRTPAKCQFMDTKCREIIKQRRGSGRMKIEEKYGL